VHEALNFLRRHAIKIAPKREWPTGAVPNRRGRIAMELRNAEGRALGLYGDPGWGEAVQHGKYGAGMYSDDLVQAAAELIQTRWRPNPPPAWVTAVPSRRHPALVMGFAQRLADRLGLPCQVALEKVQEVPEQKTMENRAQQAANVAAAFRASKPNVLSGPVLLVDDIVDSGWTLAMCGVLLRESGSGIVYPVALASAARRGL
jgi:ATP-dependent DNA helicase RecQ